LEYGILSTNICAASPLKYCGEGALPLKNAAEQQNICSQEVYIYCIKLQSSETLII
jgi:hypothetical protein